MLLAIFAKGSQAVVINSFEVINGVFNATFEDDLEHVFNTVQAVPGSKMVASINLFSAPVDSVEELKHIKD